MKKKILLGQPRGSSFYNMEWIRETNETTKFVLDEGVILNLLKGVCVFVYTNELE
jgi:hypothetical protein